MNALELVKRNYSGVEESIDTIGYSFSNYDLDCNCVDSDCAIND